MKPSDWIDDYVFMLCVLMICIGAFAILLSGIALLMYFGL